MKCPKYIQDALYKRSKCAGLFMKWDCIICNFLEKHGIEVESYDIATGCESYINPLASSRRILEAIEKKEKSK